MEKLNNRTCGECRYFTEEGGDCIYWCNIEAALEPCEQFELPKKPTNGDRIRAMSDEELAEKFICGFVHVDNYDKWYSTLFANPACFSSEQEAFEATLEELKKEVKYE